MKPVPTFSLLALLALTGCPAPVSLEKVTAPVRATATLEPGEAVAVLAGGDMTDEHSQLVCVSQILQQTKPPVPMIPARRFRDSLFPMFEPTTAPRTEEQLAATLSQPLVRAKIAQLNIRYLITVSGGTSSEEDSEFAFAFPIGAGAVPLGAASVGTQISELSASIWDLKLGTSAGAAQVTASGVGRFAMVTIVPVLIMIPRTEKAACRELGNQLVAFLTDAELPPESSASQSPAQPP